MKGKTVKETKGITLIALIVTIIVLLILAGVTMATLVGENGIITKAARSKLATELAQYKEEVELYKIKKISENMHFENTSLTAGKNNIFYNTQESGETGNVKTVIPSLDDKHIETFEIIKGELLVNTQDRDLIAVCQSLDIAVNPYDIVDGVLLSSNGNLLLMDENGTVTIPDNVTKIGEGAFANLNGLKTIIVPGTVKTIGANAFAYNKTLEKVIMQEGVETIEGWAFSGCSNLKQIEMPDSLIKIGEYAFYQCVSLDSITIPPKITAINGGVFDNCVSLANVTINADITVISYAAFGSTAITEIKIPKTVTTIQSNAFSGCTKLKSIDLTGNNSYIYENGMLMNVAKTDILFISSSYLSGTSTLTIPEGMTSFYVAVSQYKNLKTIEIPASLSSIGDASYFPTTIENVTVNSGNTTFASENGLLYRKSDKYLKMCYSKDKEITIQEGILNLGSASLIQATNAETINLPDSLTSISSLLYMYSTPKLKNLNIGKNVSYIDPVFIYKNPSGAAITIDNENQYYTISNNVLYSKDKKTLVTILYTARGEFTVPAYVETIGEQAFNGQGVTSVTISDGVKKIGEFAFTQCGSLNSVYVPNSVTEIGTNAFERCANLNEINIDNTENSISGAPWGAAKGMKAVIWKK